VILALALFLVLPIAIRAKSLDHGLPGGYVPDAHIVRNALGMARDKNPVPQVGQYSTYPNLLPYALLPVYVAYYAQGLATGEWTDAQTFGDHVFEHPEGPHLLARWLVMLLGALTPLVVFRAAREAGLERGAWVAGWLVTTGLLQAQLCTHERPWAPMVLFMALAAWMAIRYMNEPRMKWLGWSGVYAALSFATHQAGLPSLGICGLAWLLAPGGWAGGALKARLVRGTACVAIFGLVSVLVGHPYLLVHGRTPDAAVVGGSELIEAGGVSIGGMSLLLGFDAATLVEFARATFAYDPVVILLGLLGLVAAIRLRATRPVALWSVIWLVFFLLYQGTHTRYFLPTTVLFALPAGLFAERFSRAKIGQVFLALLLAFPLVQSVRLTWLLGQADTRADAEELLYQLPLGARTVIDRYGPDVHLSLEALDRLQEVRQLQGSGLYSRERHRRRTLSMPLGSLPDGFDTGLDVVPLEDLFEFDDRAEEVHVRKGLESLGSNPREVLASLGITNIMLVDRDLSAPNPLAFLVQGMAPIDVVDPSRREPAREAYLPTEMKFPLTALWSVDRPGPRVRLYALP
jgi:hypothetical protein